jgi:hypothetical protein
VKLGIIVEKIKNREISRVLSDEHLPSPPSGFWKPASTKLAMANRDVNIYFWK